MPSDHLLLPGVRHRAQGAAYTRAAPHAAAAGHPSLHFTFATPLLAGPLRAQASCSRAGTLYGLTVSSAPQRAGQRAAVGAGSGGVFAALWSVPPSFEFYYISMLWELNSTYFRILNNLHKRNIKIKYLNYFKGSF